MARKCTPNSDTTCSSTTFPSSYIYRYNLWTGLYMLSPLERVVANVIGFAGWFVLVWYVGSFLSGFAGAIMGGGD